MIPKTRWSYVALVVFVILLFIGIRWYKNRNQSQYTYADIQTGSSVANSQESNVYSNIVQCQVTYNTANVYATNANRQTILDAFTACVRSNVTTYVDNKCIWINNDPTTAGVNGATQGDVDAYTDYTTDTKSIQTAYVDLLTRSTSATSPTLNVVNAGLKADLTGATRRYLSRVCPNYFKTSSDDPTTTYTSWRVVTTAPAASDYKFYAGATGKVTSAMVNTWATKAADYSVNDTTNEMTVGTPYVSSGSIYNQPSSFTGVLNWELARDNGPGTNNPQS